MFFKIKQTKIQVNFCHMLEQTNNIKQVAQGKIQRNNRWINHTKRILMCKKKSYLYGVCSMTVLLLH